MYDLIQSICFVKVSEVCQGTLHHDTKEYNIWVRDETIKKQVLVNQIFNEEWQTESQKFSLKFTANHPGDVANVEGSNLVRLDRNRFFFCVDAKHYVYWKQNFEHNFPTGKYISSNTMEFCWFFSVGTMIGVGELVGVNGWRWVELKTE